MKGISMTARLVPALAAAALVLLPATAFAYVGPGAGLTMLGALWAVLLALFAAMFFLVAWPVRRMLRQARHRKARRPARGADDRTGSSKAA
jgi:membrane protein implicated in regulation of membrane protease activity